MHVGKNSSLSFLSWIEGLEIKKKESDGMADKIIENNVGIMFDRLVFF